MIRYGGPGKHRARGVPVTRGWTPAPRHRDDTRGPVETDPMNEFAAQWVAGMKLRERELHMRRMAVHN